MEFHENNNGNCSTPEFTSQIALEIYNNSDGYKTPSEMFKAQEGFEWSHIKKVFKAAKNIVKQISEHMSGRKVISEAVYDEETGELITPIQYYTPTTKTDLVNNLSCDKLDVETVLNDYMDEDTWTQFKARYDKGE